MYPCVPAAGVARARRLRVRDAGGGRVARRARAPAVAAPQPAALLAQQGARAVRALPPHAPAALRGREYRHVTASHRPPRPPRVELSLSRTDATGSPRVRPGEARVGAQAADGRAVDQQHGRAPRRGQPARQLLRQEVHMVRFII